MMTKGKTGSYLEMALAGIREDHAKHNLKRLKESVTTLSKAVRNKKWEETLEGKMYWLGLYGEYVDDALVQDILADRGGYPDDGEGMPDVLYDALEQMTDEYVEEQYAEREEKIEAFRLKEPGHWQ